MTGVATLFLAHNCNESITLSISSKFLPVVAGYKNDNFNFLSGPRFVYRFSVLKIIFYFLIFKSLNFLLKKLPIMKQALAVNGIPAESSSSGSIMPNKWAMCLVLSILN